jgi:ABC-2 type transport system permease protein
MIVSSFFLTLWNEIRMTFYMSYYYKFNTLIRLFAMFLKFVGYSFFMFGGKIIASELTSPFLGYMVWFYAFFILLDMSWGLREEMQEGTIEQLFMGTSSPNLIFASRLFAAILLTTLKLFIVLSVLVGLFHIPFTFNFAGAVTLALTLGAISGLGLAIAGLTLIMKKTETIGVFFANIFLFLSGTIVAVDKLPKFVQFIAMSFPTTQGIIVLRNTVLKGQSLSSAFADGSLVILLITAAAYLIGGSMIFSYCVRWVKNKGSLGQY